MKLEEAKSILNSFGYFLTEKSEKKYRTTEEERILKDKDFTYDATQIENKIKDIIKKHDLDKLLLKVETKSTRIDNTKYKELDKNRDNNITIEFKKDLLFLKLIEKLAKKFKISYQIFTSTIELYYTVFRQNKLSYSPRTFGKIVAQLLRERFNMPDKLAQEAAWAYNTHYKCIEYWGYKDTSLSIDRYYEKVEEYIEDKQYGGIKNFSKENLIKTLNDAYEIYVSKNNNTLKYVSNKYTFIKKLNKFYKEFDLFCYILSKEYNRPRGKLEIKK